MTKQPTVTEWLDQVETAARSAQRDGEAFSVAFARVLKAGAGQAFLDMQRQPQGRTPAPVKVLRKSPPAETAEAQLHRLAVEKAATSTGTSYEQAFAAVLATPEGVQLWQASRDAEGQR
jgi:hypothetical protein